jgi:hypothetical protein
MPTKVETERAYIKTILSSETLKGIPLAWIQTKLARLISGEPPEEVFVRQQSLNQKIRTKVRHAELALRIYELHLSGHKILKAKEMASEEFNVSYSTSDSAWKKHGKYCRKELPRESE